MGLAPLLIGKAKTLESPRGFCCMDIRVVRLLSGGLGFLNAAPDGLLLPGAAF